jgi:hypothetical protein
VLLGVGTNSQTISFSTPGGVTFPAAPFTLNATASSGLTVSLASTVTGNPAVLPVHN